MMTHDDAEELLGAYALHATSSEEREAVEVHLAECPRCRAEVEAHYEMAAMFGNTGDEAPPGLWEKIASSIAQVPPAGSEQPSPVLPGTGAVASSAAVVPIGVRPSPRTRNGFFTSVAAVAAAAVIVLGVEVAHLDNQVNGLRSETAINGLTSYLLEPHSTVTLVSANRTPVAHVVITRDGEALWYWSDLHSLPASETYQMWGLTKGQVVSLALMGPDPQQPVAFNLASTTTKIMVTAEPAGGTPQPTHGVLALGVVPTNAVS